MKILKNFSSREKILVFATIGVIVSSLFYNFIFEPVFEKYRSLNQELLDTQIESKRSLRLIAQRNRIEAEYEGFTSSLSASGSVEETMAQFSGQIEALARKSAISITNMRPQPVRDKGSYKRFIIAIKCEADISGLTKYLYELENSPLLLRVESLELNLKSGSSDILEADILISKIAFL